MWEAVKGDKAGPFAVISRSIIWNAAVSSLSYRNPARSIIANMPFAISKKKILNRAREKAQSLLEIFPVFRAIESKNSVVFNRVQIKCCPMQGVTVSALLKHNRPVPGDSHIIWNVFGGGIGEALSYLDNLADDLSFARSFCGLVEPGLCRIELFQIQVLHIRTEVRHSPGNIFIVANDHA